MRAIVGIDFAVFGIIFPILPLLARRVGSSVPEVGLLVASYSIAQIVAAPLWGRVSDGRGRRPVVLIALAGTACSCVILAVATTPAFLFAAVVINGASGGSMSVAQAALTDLVPHELHARAFGHLGAMVALGFVVGPGLAAVSGLGGVRLPFFLAGGLALINVAVATKQFPETLVTAAGPAIRATHQDPALRGDRGRHRAAQLLCIGLGCAVGGFALFETTFALVGRSRFGFGIAGTGASFVVMGLVIAAIEGRAIAPVVSRLGAVNAMMLGIFCFAAGLAVVGLSRDFEFLVVGLVVIGVGYGIVSPILTASVVRAARPERRGAALGLQQAVSSSARIIGPVIGTGALAAAGSTWTYVGAGVIVFSVAALVRARTVTETLVSATSSARFRRAGRTPE